MDVDLERTGTRSRKQHKTNSINTTTSEVKKKQTNPKHFEDSSQYTDYALLEKLLLKENVNQVSSSSALQLSSKDAHSLDTLWKLPIHIIPSTTVIVKTHSSLSAQIQAILSQSIVPDNIWITGDANQVGTLQSNKRIKFVSDALSKPKTEYTWILDEEALPGSKALEYMLKTVTDNMAVGTEGEQQEHCVWTEKSKAVEKLRDSYLLRSDWVPYKDSLYQHGIRSTLLPSNTADKNYWGNTRRQNCTPAVDVTLNLPEKPILIQAMTKPMQTLACEFVRKDKKVVIVTQEDLECNSKHAFKNAERVIDFIQPSVVITDKALDAPGIPVIHLPKEVIPNASWLVSLPTNLLREWNKISIKIMVTVNKKNDNLERLLNSLNTAHYLGDTIDLTLLMDYTTDHTIHHTVDRYHWPHGPKYLRHRIASSHRMAQFAESWYPTSNNDYAIILDTELELSPLFYIWAKYAVLRYRRSNQQLFGISLYRPELIETDPEGRRLFTERPDSEFLMQWPTHSGALFFPEHWREYHDYLTARLADREGLGMMEVSIPDSRSNEWKLSWRRYFEELVYLRSYVMLYPPVSLSTHHIELKKKSQREKYADALTLYDVPLMTNMTTLPAWKELPVVDIYGKLSDFNTLLARGSELQDEISSCLPRLELNFDPSDLLCPFSRIVTVTVENEDDPPVKLPLKKVDVFV
ncbi:hypothetical protein BY458DRAFT_551081 [Sporodiniella umbellata]|nr:hypothetical protein BY458DRAFT_551081 [Sporodiniella umbellata]